MKKLPNHLAFHLTKEDFETTSYMNPTGCALATAIERAGYKLGAKGHVGVGGSEAYFEGEGFRIVRWSKIRDAYSNPPAEGLMVNLLKIDD